MAERPRRLRRWPDLGLGVVLGGALATGGVLLWAGALHRPAPAATPPRADAALCARALGPSATAWDNRPVFRADVAQAQLAALTVAACRTALDLDSAPLTGAPPPAPPQQPPLAQAGYEDIRTRPPPAHLRYQDIEVDLDSAPGKQTADQRVPVFTGRYRGKPIFTLRLDDAVAWHDRAEVRWLDRTSAAPQIVLSAYTGGAHCCTITRIATLTADGWHLVDAGTLDGDGGYAFIDLTGDGAAELLSVDNRFLYAFDCYACSYAPTVIERLSGLSLRDVTREPRYRPYLRGVLQRLEAGMQDGVGNGFLAGWVAESSLAGTVAETWPAMLARYQPPALEPFTLCLTGAPAAECPQGPTYPVAFPQALAAFLVQNGYLTEAQAFWLGKLAPRRVPPITAPR